MLCAAAVGGMYLVVLFVCYSPMSCVCAVAAAACRAPGGMYLAGLAGVSSFFAGSEKIYFILSFYYRRTTIFQTPMYLR